MTQNDFSANSKVYLLGVRHSPPQQELSGQPGNYLFVKECLERIQPSIVTAEVRLHEMTSGYVIGTGIFTRDVDGLESEILEVDEECLQMGTVADRASEYFAGIIYCRRQNIPLHFIDLGPATLEKAVSTNVLVLNPEEVWEEPEWPEEHVNKQFSMTHRNRFMATALRQIHQDHTPATIAHIGGKGHYSLKDCKVTLPSLLSPLSVQVINRDYRRRGLNLKL